MKKGQKLNRPRQRSVGLRIKDSVYARVERLANARRGSITGVIEECLENSMPMLETRYAEILKNQAADGTSWDTTFSSVDAQVVAGIADRYRVPHENPVVPMPELPQPAVVRPLFSIHAHAIAAAA